MYDDDDTPPMSFKMMRIVLRVLSERCSAVYPDPFEAHDAEEGLSFVIRGRVIKIYAWRSSSERVLRSLPEGNLSEVEGKLCFSAPLDWVLWLPSL